MGWVFNTTSRSLQPGKHTRYPFLHEAGWASGSVWRGAGNLATTAIRFPDRPARSELLCRLTYSGTPPVCIAELKNKWSYTSIRLRLMWECWEWRRLCAVLWRYQGKPQPWRRLVGDVARWALRTWVRWYWRAVTSSQRCVSGLLDHDVSKAPGGLVFKGRNTLKTFHPWSCCPHRPVVHTVSIFRESL